MLKNYNVVYFLGFKLFLELREIIHIQFHTLFYQIEIFQFMLYLYI